MRPAFPFPMPNGWFQVAYGDELAAGEVKALHYFDRELVLFRTEDGAAHVFDAYCPHLGAHLGKGGTVDGNRLRCPFHHWAFDGDGRCADVPYAKRIPPKASVHSWPLQERDGLIMVWMHKDGEPPSFQLPEIPEYASDEWTDYIRRDWVVKNHAQELAENTVDPAHFKYVHKTAELPKAEAFIEDHVLRVEMDYPIVMGENAQAGTIDIRAHGMGFGLTRFRGIVDTTVVVTGTPIDNGTVHNRLSFMVKKLDSPQATEGLGNAFVNEISRQFSEDMPIWENKIYLDKPLLCDGDGPIATLRRWAQQFY